MAEGSSSGGGKGAGLFTAISSGVGAIGSLLGGLMGKNEGRDARRWQEKMYYLDREYNTPLNQRKRMIEAGLNPSLMYETMPQNTTGSPPSSPSFAPNYLGQGISDFGQGLQNAINMAVQNDNIRAETALKIQELKQKEEAFGGSMERQDLENKGIELENNLKDIRNRYAEEFNKLSNQGLDLNNKTVAKKLSYMDRNQRLFVREQLAKIANIKADTDLKSKMVIKTQVETAIQEFERKYREQGMSFGDNVIFREVKGTLHGLLDTL